jgi:uncharacterized membrane protein YidH (DUF202 family)
MLIPGIVLLLIGVILSLKAFSAFQKRDKRYKKGVKIKTNTKAIIYLIFGVVLITVSIKFLMV